MFLDKVCQGIFIMKISLIRHTSVELDGTHYCYGALDVKVIESNFEKEAMEAFLSLQGFSFDAVFTSPLTRACRLASFCGFENAERDERLREMNFGDWEGLLWRDILGGKDIIDFFSSYTDKTPNGESLNDLNDRVRSFIKEKKELGFKHILVFCHGGVIRAAKNFVLSKEITDKFEPLPEFASHTLLEF